MYRENGTLARYCDWSVRSICQSQQLGDAHFSLTMTHTRFLTIFGRICGQLANISWGNYFGVFLTNV
ncbi:hypothetical protein Y032_0013g2062 [Ancylostoma ceylanicum]|uniref:Uncharacterized protein n=1 Tax=Ancylostoma ceylanicum TaxID=53326 RepID=A0A016VAL4_9BILA|nr:hypothetical protein Y032_0013g2062 [Ancylostoma ceylanicum]